MSFKVGDNVERINGHNGGSNARVGQVATVIEVISKTWIAVTYEGRAREEWLTKNAKLVEKEKKMPYEFKVGDKGKTRSWHDYEVIAVHQHPKMNEADRLAILVTTATGDRILSHRTLTGKFFTNSDAASDLIPPERAVYINVSTPIGGNGVATTPYNTEAEAREWADSNKNHATYHAVALKVPLKEGEQ